MLKELSRIGKHNWADRLGKKKQNSPFFFKAKKISAIAKPCLSNFVQTCAAPLGTRLGPFLWQKRSD
jgi:hypothetical protein